MEWLRHDTTALSDTAVQVLIDRQGAAGYGVFWAIIETLARTPDGQARLDQLLPVARFLNVKPAKILEVLDILVELSLLELVGLQHDDDTREAVYRSRRLTEEIAWKEAKREKRVRAGRLGGRASARARAEQSSSDAEASAKQVPEQTSTPTRARARVRSGKVEVNPLPPETSLQTEIGGSLGEPPVTREAAGAYFEKKEVPKVEGFAFWEYWDARDWTYVDGNESARKITENTWRKRAGYWIGKWRRDTARGVNGRARRNAAPMSYQEMIADWEKRGRPKIEDTYERTEDNLWRLA